VPQEQCCTFGDAVLPGTGRKLHAEADYVGAGSDPLTINRYYSSAWADGLGDGLAPVAPWGVVASVGADQSLARAVVRRVGTHGHDGKLTFYRYNVNGQEVERANYGASYATATTRPALSVAERVVSTRWHATWNLPTQVAEPGKVTAYTYSGKGNVSGQSWTATSDSTGAAAFNATKNGSTYATGWSYNVNSLASATVEKVDGVEAQRWTMGYSAGGDPTNIADVTQGGTARVSAYDAHGRMLRGTTDTGVPMSATYTRRGSLEAVAREGKTTSYGYDGRGLFTQASLPTGDRFDLSYDASGNFVEARHNGTPLNAQTLAKRIDRSPASFYARLMPLVEKATSALVKSAWAQVVIFPDPRPRPPVFDPRTDMLMSPMTPADKLKRKIEEKRQRDCQCDPNGGYSKPTLTPGTYFHLWLGGHMKAMYSDKSHFTVPANQALVDRIVSTTAPKPAKGGRIEYRAEMQEYVGKMPFPKGSGVFVETKKVTLIVQTENCTGKHARNEVVTMHPGWEYDDGP
jgi:hypothetical protein